MPMIVVPFRGATGKQRLGPLPEGARAALTLAMLADVLAATTVVGETYVVTADGEGALVAREFEARVVADPGGGQGTAVSTALRDLPERRTLVVNADVPCTTPADVRELDFAVPELGIAYVAARDGTTNALGLSSPALFAPLYGARSCERFALGVDVTQAKIANLIDDVDTLEDLERLEPRLGPRTLSTHAVR
jgi:2-phospho-L-lactate guanylyltransferase